MNNVQILLLVSFGLFSPLFSAKKDLFLLELKKHKELRARIKAKKISESKTHQSCRGKQDDKAKEFSVKRLLAYFSQQEVVEMLLLHIHITKGEWDKVNGLLDYLGKEYFELKEDGLMYFKDAKASHFPKLLEYFFRVAYVGAESQGYLLLKHCKEVEKNGFFNYLYKKFQEYKSLIKKGKNTNKINEFKKRMPWLIEMVNERF